MTPEFEANLTRRVLSLPESVRWTLTGEQPVTRRGHKLDGDIAAILSMLARLGRSDLDIIGRRKGVNAAREANLFSFRTGSVGASELPVVTKDITVPGDYQPLNARLYTPKTPSDGLLVFFHGGGFVVGSVEAYDGMCRYAADRMQMQVLSVDYRLGPEHLFPAAPKDAIAVIQAVVADPASFAPGAVRVAVGGDSAGAALALIAGQHVEGLEALWLLYPVCDFVNDYPSLTEMGTGFGLTKNLIYWFAENYIGDADRADPLGSPLLADTWGSVPKTWVSGAVFDPLLDQSAALADKMKGLNIDVTYQVEVDMIHAYANLFGLSDGAKSAFNRACDWLSGAMKSD